MGWLQHAWQRSGFKSANDLAARLLEHERWPSTTSIKPRSLGNNLRALDRGQRLRWWRTHHQLLELLAELIERSPAELDGLLTEDNFGAATKTPTSRIALADLGVLRALDMSEDLPPGIPDLVGRPARWRRHWWCTFDHRARRIAGRWLSTRRDVRYVTATSLTDALPRLPESGRVFLEVATLEVAGEPGTIIDARELDDLQICVAAPFPPRAGALVLDPGKRSRWRRSSEPDEWSVLEPSPSWFQEIIGWVTSRLPQRLRQDRDDLAEQLRALERDDMLAGCGDVLDFAGLWTAFRKPARPAPGDKAAWARIRFSGEPRGSESTVSAAVITALLRQTIEVGEHDWPLGLSRFDWGRLLQSANTQLFDRAAALAVIERADGPLPEESVKQLREALTPAPGHQLETILRANSMSTIGGDCYVIDPPWAAVTLHGEALDQLLDGDARALGAALLKSDIADAVIEALVLRFSRGQLEAARKLLTDSGRSTSDPRELATYQACTCALGLACLINEDIPDDVVASARAAQLQTYGHIDLSPIGPVIPFAVAKTSKWSPEIYWLAVLTLSAHSDGKPSSDSTEHTRLFHRASRALPRLRSFTLGSRLVDGAFRLGAREVNREPQLSGSSESDIIRLPARLVQFPRLWAALGVDDASFASRMLRQFAVLRFLDPYPPGDLIKGLEAVEPLMQGSLSDAFDTLWSVWAKSPDIHELPPVVWLDQHPDAASVLWRHGEPSDKRPVLKHLLRERLCLPIVSRALRPVDFEMWIKVAREVAHATFGAADEFSPFWMEMPVDMLVEHMESRAIEPMFDQVVLTCAWTRIPEELTQFVRERPLAEAMKIAAAAPTAQLDVLGAVVLVRLRSAEKVDASALSSAASFLERVIQGRRPGWRKCVRGFRRIFAR